MAIVKQQVITNRSGLDQVRLVVGVTQILLACFLGQLLVMGANRPGQWPLYLVIGQEPFERKTEGPWVQFPYCDGGARVTNHRQERGAACDANEPFIKWGDR